MPKLKPARGGSALGGKTKSARGGKSTKKSLSDKYYNRLFIVVALLAFIVIGLFMVIVHSQVYQASVANSLMHQTKPVNCSQDPLVTIPGCAARY